MKTVTPEMIKELREMTGVSMSKCKEALVESNGDKQKAVDYLRKAGMTSALKKEGRETKEGMIGFAETPEVLVLIEANTETDFVAQNERFRTFLQDICEQAAKTKPASLQVFIDQIYSKDKKITIDQYRNLVIQALGENIQIRRLEVIPKDPNCSLGVYSHMKGKLVTIVEIKGKGEEEIAKEIAMHVAADNPEYVNPEDLPESVKAREEEIARAQIKGKPENVVEKIVIGKIKAYCDQFCLTCQKFVKNPDVTVGQYLDQRAKDTKKALSIRRFWRWRVGQ
ncbi:MAG TPA: translation elongation factor Ts [Chlamydiales bacterium]|nr:translation elongation factor Ts [Chlamydiales bacterium]